MGGNESKFSTHKPTKRNKVKKQNQTFKREAKGKPDLATRSRYRRTRQVVLSGGAELAQQVVARPTRPQMTATITKTTQPASNPTKTRRRGYEKNKRGQLIRSTTDNEIASRNSPAAAFLAVLADEKRRNC